MLVHVYVAGTKIFPVLDWATYHEDVWGRRGIIPRILSLVAKSELVLCLMFRPGRNSDISCKECWVGLTSGVEAVAKSKNSTRSGNTTLIP